MKAVILAAGRGKRLKGFTEDKPKCLNLVGGKTILERQISALKSGGISDIVIVTGYRSKMLEDAGARTIHNPDWEKTNMLRSLLCAGAEFTGPVIVSYSDILYGKSVVSSLLSQIKDAVVAYDLEWEKLWNKRFKDPLSDAESFKIGPDGRIREIGMRVRSAAEIEGQYMGLMRFTPGAFLRIKDFTSARPDDVIDRMDMTTLLQGLVTEGYPVYGMAIKGGWCEIDTVSDLALASDLYTEGSLAI